MPVHDPTRQRYGLGTQGLVDRPSTRRAGRKEANMAKRDSKVADALTNLPPQAQQDQARGPAPFVPAEPVQPGPAQRPAVRPVSTKPASQPAAVAPQPRPGVGVQPVVPTMVPTSNVGLPAGQPVVGVGTPVVQPGRPQPVPGRRR